MSRRWKRHLGPVLVGVLVGLVGSVVLPFALLIVELSAAPPGRDPATTPNPAPTGGGGGGSPNWYDVEVAANADTYPANSTSEYHTALVTAGQTGNATKIRVYIQTQGDSVDANMKAAIYTTGGSLLASGSVVIAPSDDGVYKEVTITSTGVSSGTQYRIAFMFDNSNVYYAYKAATGALDIHTGAAFGSFPYDPVGTPTFDDLARNVVAGIYVE